MAIFDRDELRALATETTDQPVLSVYVRTDPRDPANTNHTPAWEIELRNGLRAVSEKLDGDQTQQRSFEALRARVERELVELSASEQGRSVAWFLQADGETSRRMTLQVPVRHDQVVWDDRPFVSPLVDVADRGAMSGVVLVGGDFVRLLQIANGNIDEPDDSTYELSLGDWRPYEAYASANPARGQQTVSHRERYKARVSEHRGQLFETAAAATAGRVEDLGWERIVIATEGQFASRFEEALPEALRTRVVATIDHNVGARRSTRYRGDRPNPARRCLARADEADRRRGPRTSERRRRCCSRTPGDARDAWRRSRRASRPRSRLRFQPRR